MQNDVKLKVESLLQPNKIVISVGQALLIAMDDTRDPAQLDHLSRLYLCGTGLSRNQDQKISSEEAINQIIEKVQIDSNYIVSKDFEVTNTDPSRPYFETHLALAILKYNIEKINLNELHRLHDDLYEQLPNDLKEECAEIFEKNNLYANSVASINVSELIHSIEKIETHFYFQQPEFSKENRMKIGMLIKISHVARLFLMAKFDELPLPDIFLKSGFDELHKGELPKEDQGYPAHVRSNNLGVIKSTMPVPVDDFAYTPQGNKFHKGADSANANQEAKWVKHVAAKWVHPFSLGISGHLVGTVKALLWQYQKKALEFNTLEKLILFLQCRCAATLALRGGHTLYEYSAVLELENVRDCFKPLLADEVEKLTMENIFLDSNAPAFKEALKNTLKYNKNLLKQKKLNQSLLTAYPKKILEEAIEHKLIGELVKKELVKVTNASELDNLVIFLQQIIHRTSTSADNLRRSITFRNLDWVKLFTLDESVVCEQAQNGDSALSLAIKLGKLDVIQYFADRTAGRTDCKFDLVKHARPIDFIHAIKAGHLQILDYFKKAGLMSDRLFFEKEFEEEKYNVEAQRTKRELYDKGYYALLESVIEKPEKILLARQFLDADTFDAIKKLMINVVMGKHWDVLSFLLSFDINLQESNLASALFVMILNNNYINKDIFKSIFEDIFIILVKNIPVVLRAIFDVVTDKKYPFPLSMLLLKLIIKNSREIEVLFPEDPIKQSLFQLACVAQDVNTVRYILVDEAFSERGILLRALSKNKQSPLVEYLLHVLKINLKDVSMDNLIEGTSNSQMYSFIESGVEEISIYLIQNELLYNPFRDAHLCRLMFNYSKDAPTDPLKRAVFNRTLDELDFDMAHFAIDEKNSNKDILLHTIREECWYLLECLISHNELPDVNNLVIQEEDLTEIKDQALKQLILHLPGNSVNAWEENFAKLLKLIPSLSNRSDINMLKDNILSGLASLESGKSPHLPFVFFKPTTLAPPIICSTHLDYIRSLGGGVGNVNA